MPAPSGELGGTRQHPREEQGAGGGTDLLPVALDVDTGVDDALALLYAVASPALDLRLVSCVGGNADLDAVTATTTAVLAEAGSQVPVHLGHAHPLSGPRPPAEAWQASTG